MCHKYALPYLSWGLGYTLDWAYATVTEEWKKDSATPSPTWPSSGRVLILQQATFSL